MNTIDKIGRIKRLTSVMNVARDSYYNKAVSQMSDYEYDTMFDELKELEKSTNFVMANSPTKFVGYEVKSKLAKVEHRHPMLSLDKTKSVQDLYDFLGDRDGVLMLKLDGLTVSLEYNNGELTAAETRGDSIIGEDVLSNAFVFENIPKHIDFDGKLVIDGEAIITYDDFEKINALLPEDEKYKNPRNLVSGSVRQLDSKIAAARHIKFVAWKCIEGIKCNSHSAQLNVLEELGFEIVEYLKIQEMSSEGIYSRIDGLKERAAFFHIPIDGMVLGYDDVEYGKSLGATGHHLRSQIAFKFYDEEEVTKLRDIEWSMGQTGTLTPVAIFNPVEIEGTEVSRASLHNVSIMEALELGIGDEITVYKSNQIIPKVRENLTRSNTARYPDVCPICGEATSLNISDTTKVLYCTNDDCKGKLLGRFENFVKKSAMNIDGLSGATLSRLIENGWLENFQDLYHINQYADEICKMDGFGKKSCTKLLASIENSRTVKLENFLVALGIPNVGRTASKAISKAFGGSYDIFLTAYMSGYSFSSLPDFGAMTETNIKNYMAKNLCNIAKLVSELSFELCNIEPKNAMKQAFCGKTFVVTGSLQNFTRTSIQEKLEDLGAHAGSSVSKKTDYLLAGENAGSKLTKAKELGVKILTEEEFMKMI